MFMPVHLNFQLGEKSLTLDTSLVDMDKHSPGTIVMYSQIKSKEQSKAYPAMT